MSKDIGERVLAPAQISSGLAWVLCQITAWQDFSTIEGYERIYECTSIDGKYRVVVSEELLRTHKWK